MVVLLLTAISAVLMAHEARKEGASDVLVVMALAYTAAVGGCLALAWLMELVAGLVYLFRRVSFMKVLGRVVLAQLPLAALVIGQIVFNPWLPGLLLQARHLVQG